MIRRPPRSTQGVSSAASDVYKRQYQRRVHGNMEELKTMIHNFTSQGVPIDALWVDIELLDNGKNFIVDSTKFPDLKKFVEEELHSNNIHFMPVLEPGLKADPHYTCLLYTSPSPRDLSTSRMPSSA
eukprot:TRINITY_DN43758_c0_g1_i1.p2 TRINITY_DN43758_c0_g1~~TRINITY_DN43758_c0_g1_i1.p2  ORF type:complete len:127 (+),score=40.15 TRINITY_DN43758_c0_g1_i1:74-454(+)